MGRLKQFAPVTSQREFDQIYRRADKVWHTPCFVLFFRKGSREQAAFVAGKKVGKAVQRNRAKRRMRALFLSTSSRVIPGAYIMVAKAAILQADYSELERQWHTALKRSGAWKKSRG